jgi:fatty acid desaturase
VTAEPAPTTPPDHVVLQKLFLRLLFTLPITGSVLLIWREAPWWLFVVHALLVAADFDRFTLLLHNLSHIPQAFGPYRALGRGALAYLGLFFGQTPATYRAHHVGMHHREENGRDDLSTTLPYQRDSFVDFLRYFLTFIFGTIWLLPSYFWKNDRKDWSMRAFWGEVSGLAIFAVCYAWNPPGALLVLALPFTLSRFLMMAGNWAQHAFVDPAAPQDPYRSILTVLSPRYNRRCFNDGYHLTHHLHPVMAYDVIPKHFDAVKGEYGQKGAIVIVGPDFVAVWWLLMWGRYETLAKCVLNLDGKERTREQIVELLKSRLVPIQLPESAPVTATSG